MHKTNDEHMNIYIYMDTKLLMTTIAYCGRLPEGIPLFIFSIHKRHRFQGMAGMGTGPILWYLGGSRPWFPRDLFTCIADHRETCSRGRRLDYSTATNFSHHFSNQQKIAQTSSKNMWVPFQHQTNFLYCEPVLQ